MLSSSARFLDQRLLDPGAGRDEGVATSTRILHSMEVTMTRDQGVCHYTGYTLHRAVCCIVTTDQGVCHYTAYTLYTGLAHNNQLHPRPQRQLLLRALLHHARLGHRARHQRSEPGGGWSGAIRFQVTRPVTAQKMPLNIYTSLRATLNLNTLKYKLG